MTNRFYVVGAAALCAVAGSTFGQVTYVARNSQISASSTQGPTNSQGTVNFDPFNQSVSSNGFRGNGAASQQSTLSASAITWSTSSTALSVFGSPMSGGSGAANANNTLSVTFDVASLIGFEISGAQPLWPGFVGSTYIHLNRISGEGGAASIYSHQYPDADGSYFASGVLTPGQYTLSVDFSLHAAAGAVWSFDGTGQLVFTPAPGAAAALGMAGVFASRRRR
ncbi:MAG: hypothetical protein QM783_15365 [Phycisphaerales bacterium]